MNVIREYGNIFVHGVTFSVIFNLIVMFYDTHNALIECRKSEPESTTSDNGTYKPSDSSTYSGAYQKYQARIELVPETHSIEPIIHIVNGLQPFNRRATPIEVSYFVTDLLRVSPNTTARPTPVDQSASNTPICLTLRPHRQYSNCFPSPNFSFHQAPFLSSHIGDASIAQPQHNTTRLAL